ncbi:CPBP family intramembrane glutamic endopeptidase [Halanaeroarchaeum sulfurireducens]|uniref:Metal-dependent membrane protease n=1 Tax=Halanaeroarchaeum sulfurireducens TaxID=1604004 RepID=A0A0F7PBU2_9EURY|nr:CPBP family intramembrane glutamic endopeptidase [Halanaeroarchaeum sulfurireducens]AKH97114.1 metal-dependent membrane protease [Halanaeroarchaeum sulfurireducens]
MTRWGVFLGLVLFVTAVVVVLARSSARALDDELASVSGRALRWNVAVSQALVAILVLAGAWLVGVPWTALGLGSAIGPTGESLMLGLALGAPIALGNALLSRSLDAKFLRDAAVLRRRLAPDTAIGWVTLLIVVIPAVAVAEELLFRGALVGALAVGFPVSPWLLAVLSSLAFGAAHAAQGTMGIVVAGVLGFVLAIGFVLSGDLLVVIVAHVVVDVVEFAVHEGPV